MSSTQFKLQSAFPPSHLQNNWSNKKNLMLLNLCSSTLRVIKSLNHKWPFCLVLRFLKYLTYNTHTGFKTFSPKKGREKFSQDLSSRYSWYQLPPQTGLLSVGQRSCQEAGPFPLHIWSEAKSVVLQLLERPPRVRWIQQWPYVTIMACRVEEKR